jgi:hypothetical protein
MPDPSGSVNVLGVLDGVCESEHELEQRCAQPRTRYHLQNGRFVVGNTVALSAGSATISNRNCAHLDQRHPADFIDRDEVAAAPT